MVRVEMRHDQVINRSYTRVARGRQNPVRVARLLRIAGHAVEAAVFAREARVDEDRLSGPRHDKRRLTTLDVDEVDVKCRSVPQSGPAERRQRRRTLV